MTMGPISSDVVVVLPGIMGSTLALHGRPVWAPSAGALLRAVATFGASITRLQLPDALGDEHPDDGVTATGLMPGVHALPGVGPPVRGYDRLLARLRKMGHTEQAGTLVPFPYDWRLSNRYNARRLAAIAENALARRRDQHPAHTDAQLVLVGHSMGGLIAQHYLAHADPDLIRAVITLGTPRRGAASAITQLVNGVHRGLGPLAVDLTAFARSLPSLHQLLPSYACLDSGHGPLTPLSETPLPDLDPTRVADAAAFHHELAYPGENDDGRLHRIVGARQPTPTTVHTGTGYPQTLPTYRATDTGEPDQDYGDATVPAVGALPPGVPLDTNRAHRVFDQHGNLQRNHSVLDSVQAIIEARPVIRRAPDARTVPRVEVPDMVLHGQPVDIRIGLDGEPHRIRVTVADEHDDPVVSRTPAFRNKHIATTIDDLDPGAYTITVDGGTPHSSVTPVTATIVVWPLASP